MPDRAKVIKALEDFNKNRICLPHLIPWDEIADAIAALKEQPEIVRCKNCKHYDDVTTECADIGSPCYRNGYCEPDWFCADGARKEP